TPSFDPVVASLSPSLTPFEDSDFLLEETDAFLALDDSLPPEIDNGIYDSKGDILFLEKLLNNDPTKDLLPKETTKSSIEEPPELELKDLPPHLEYALLEGTSKLPVIIAKDLKMEEKDQLIKLGMNSIVFLINFMDTSKFLSVPKPFGLCNAPRTFQRCMVAIFHDMIEKTMEVFMDDFLVFGDSFSSCLSNLDMMLKRCEDTNLVLNWEKCHFMVKEGIVLGHKISKNGIEVDRTKVDVIAKLPHPTTVKGIRSFLEFDIEIRNKRGAENLAVDH
ncbi:reverse transcriptase domain-containing protein, partial [Tanacetum coccineum]